MLDHIGISVGDLEVMAQWYCRALDMRRTGTFSVPELQLRGTFVLGQGGLTLELLERAGSTPGSWASAQPTALLTRGYGHICMRVSDVDQMHSRLLTAGAAERMSPRPAPEPGVRMSFVADPEGNFIELIDRKEPLV